MAILDKHVEGAEDHYWEADGLNEELLERFIITNSDGKSSDDDEGVNEGFSDDSTSVGLMSESILCYHVCCMLRNDGMSVLVPVSAIGGRSRGARGAMVPLKFQDSP